MESAGVNDNFTDSNPRLASSYSDMTSRIASEDKFIINGQEYVKESVLSSTKRNISNSWICDHGVELVDISNEKKFWKCILCRKPVLYQRSFTDHPMNHLKRIYNLSKDEPITSSNRITAVFQKTPTIMATSALLTRVDQDFFQKRLLE